MQTAFVKTSISIPSDMLDWVKSRAVAEGQMPVSRIITQALREKMTREEKAKKGGRK